MSDDEPIDLETYEWSDEEDNQLLVRVFEKHFPGPGNFHCLKCVDKYRERVIFGAEMSDDSDSDESTSLVSAPGRSRTPRKQKAPKASTTPTKNRTENAKKLEIWQPPPMPMQDRSVLTAKEQADYVVMMRQMKENGPLHFTGNVGEFRALKDRLKPEWEKFNTVVADITRKTLLRSYNNVAMNSRTYLLQCMRAKATVTRLLSGRFTMRNLSNIFPPSGGMPILSFAEYIMDTGRARHVSLPDLNSKISIPIQKTSVIDATFPSSEKGKEGLLHGDTNILPLATEYQADFVVSVSGIRSLILWTGPHLANECELPVSVSTMDSKDEKKKYVIVGKPLPPRVLTGRQQLSVLAKYGMKAILIDSKGNIAQKRTEKPSSSRSCVTDVEDNDDDDEEDISPRKRANSIRRSSETGKRVLFKLHGRIWRPGAQPLFDVNPPTKTGYMHRYSLWTLDKRRILIRSNVDAIKPTDTNGHEAHVGISANVEYQPSYGAEVQTNEEIAYEWLTGYLKRSDIHYRGRVKHSSDHDLLSLDVLTRNEHFQLSNLELETQQLIAHGMRRLHALLDELKRLNEGTYLLSLKSSEPYSYTLYEPMEEQSMDYGQNRTKPDIDLFKWYADGLRTERMTRFEDCWRNIDPEVILFWHQLQKRAPASFPPQQDPAGQDDGSADAMEVDAIC